MEEKWRRTVWTAGEWRTWLTDHGSLTRRLQARCQAFRVNRLVQMRQRPCRDEFAPLALTPGRFAWVREVLLLDADTPLVFAHSVMTLDGLRGPWAGLTGLGNRPLGAALFADPRVQRHPLEARRLDRDRKSTRLNSSHIPLSRMPSSA